MLKWISLVFQTSLASKLLLLVMFCYAVSARLSANQADNDILDNIFRNKYDKRVLPPSDGPVIVNVTLLLLSLSSPDESSLKYEIEFVLNQHWFDDRLSYGNRSSKTYLNGYNHIKQIWLPETIFMFHGHSKVSVNDNIILRIFSNGLVQYTVKRSLTLSCVGTLNIFPFDFPLCAFSMESISYEKDVLVYEWITDSEGGNGIIENKHLSTLNAYLIDNNTLRCDKRTWRGEFSCLRVQLKFSRDKAFYYTTVFIPGIILVTSSFSSFWLEWNAVPARVMIGVTTILNFFTTSNGFRSNLPVVSNLTAMNAWDGVCMVFIYASMLEFIVVNYIGRMRKTPVIIRRVKRMQVLPVKHADFHLPDYNSNNRNGNVNTKADRNNRITVLKKNPAIEEQETHQIKTAKNIDVFSRMVFPIAFSCFLIYFFFWYIIQ